MSFLEEYLSFGKEIPVSLSASASGILCMFVSTLKLKPPKKPLQSVISLASTLCVTLIVCSHVLLILSTLTISHICLPAFLHTSVIEEGRSYGQKNIVEIGRKGYFCLYYGCSV